jgi:HEXXH motif-containing protein
MLRFKGAALDLPRDVGGPLSARLTSLSAHDIAELADRDIHVIAPSVITAANGLVDRAEQLTRFAPGLQPIVRSCLQEIYSLKAPDDSFDISHSEPRWPTRIFVSFPVSSIVAELRVAEAIVHEAMHLNLTFLEGRARLVARPRMLYSPWKAEARPASGVVHGLYVFACIYSFFRYLSREVSLDDRQQRHVNQRFVDIKAEVGSIDRSSLLACLTPDGDFLVRTFFASIED